MLNSFYSQQSVKLSEVIINFVAIEQILNVQIKVIYYYKERIIKERLVYLVEELGFINGLRHRKKELVKDVLVVYYSID